MNGWRHPWIPHKRKLNEASTPLSRHGAHHWLAGSGLKSNSTSQQGAGRLLSCVVQDSELAAFAELSSQLSRITEKTARMDTKHLQSFLPSTQPRWVCPILEHSKEEGGTYPRPWPFIKSMPAPQPRINFSKLTYQIPDHPARRKSVTANKTRLAHN
ncbi:hypothetical protein H109_03549 [Trichophyton interdigitale MR816]|uniref:Uncharacterized protein n=1 Tax=Trichophyton interdigitale (strain MR816) TaxID=1215338 RepID=A0A059J9Q3_TRIIM|nr:hypothetical protein H109_03549 [Trichophyton interdigitale MR816]